jgi:hypothetical protein
MNVVALLQCVLAAKNAKGAKELGWGFALSVYTAKNYSSAPQQNFR